jgi:hypothetical protein
MRSCNPAFMAGLQRVMLLVAFFQKLRIWLISASVSDAAHHLRMCKDGTLEAARRTD